MGYIITQLNGDNVPHYEKIYGKGIGHTAIDYRSPDGIIRALFDYKIVKDNDFAHKGEGYGNNVTGWCEALNMAFRHCHLERNFVSVGDIVKVGQPIGVEGASQTQAKHDHLEAIVVDDNGYRQSQRGVNGKIDPLVYFLRAFGDPDWVDDKPWDKWQKANPEWVLGKYIYGPSTLGG